MKDSSACQPVVLVTGDGDLSLPGEYDFSRAIIDSQKVQRWYVQNWDGTGGPKVAPYPIGLDLHTPREIEGERVSGAPVYLALHDSARKARKQRQALVVCDALMSCCINCDDRRRAKAAVTGLERFIIPQGGRLPQKELWDLYAASEFVLSPAGHGLDCHRTWEALYLGCTVICKSSTIDPLYQGLSVYTVREWEEIREPGFLAGGRADCKGSLCGPQALAIDRWRPKPPLRVAVLIIASRSKIFDAMTLLWLRSLSAVRDSALVPLFCYGANSEPHPGVPSEWVFTSSKPESIIPGVAVKTMECLESVLHSEDVTHVVRTNLSCVWDFPTLRRVLSSTPGPWSPLDGEEPQWPQGSSIILSREEALVLLDHREEIETSELHDDVAIGRALGSSFESPRPVISRRLSDEVSEEQFEGHVRDLMCLSTDIWPPTNAHLRARGAGIRPVRGLTQDGAVGFPAWKTALGDRSSSGSPKRPTDSRRLRGCRPRAEWSLPTARPCSPSGLTRPDFRVRPSSSRGFGRALSR